ncbi:MAG: ROK family protein [Acidaminococcaceae bacterium]|nr:ROK family protein [Acidaminococcaceae bacterium]MDD4721438.1 ROK family protein [Acidaminococcaceae bacterium]
MTNYMGIDIGGTNMKGLILNDKHAALSNVCVPSCSQEGSERVCKQMFFLIEQLLAQSGLSPQEITRICIGIPGHWDKKKKVLCHCSNLPLENIPFVENIEKHYGLPVITTNDANAATWGEYMLGAGQGSTNMLFVTISTGIGAGAIINHKLFTGSSGNALELGHITIEQNGRLCSCGNHGCAELYASGSAIAKAAEYMRFSLDNNITAENVFQAAADGNSKACFIIRDAMHSLGACLSVAAELFDPDIIVVGGGLAKAGPQVLNAIKTGIRERCAKPIANNTQIKLSQLGDNAGVYGAALLAAND